MSFPSSPSSNDPFRFLTFEASPLGLPYEKPLGEHYFKLASSSPSSLAVDSTPTTPKVTKETELTLEKIEGLFHLRMVDAAKELNINEGNLRSTCRKFGIIKWPYKTAKHELVEANLTLESISLDNLSKYFHLPITEASKKLGVCITSLKKICRRHNITRWPSRKLNSKKISAEEKASITQTLLKGPKNDN